MLRLIKLDTWMFFVLYVLYLFGVLEIFHGFKNSDNKRAVQFFFILDHLTIILFDLDSLTFSKNWGIINIQCVLRYLVRWVLIIVYICVTTTYALEYIHHPQKFPSFPFVVNSSPHPHFSDFFHHKLILSTHGIYKNGVIH